MKKKLDLRIRESLCMIQSWTFLVISFEGKKNLSLLEKKRAKGKLKMSLDWITGDDDEENTPKPQPDLKIETTVTVIKEENISHNSSPSVLVDAVTIDSLPVHDLTTESPFLSERQNATVNGTQGTFIGFEGEKKAHQLGNSTGKGL